MHADDFERLTHRGQVGRLRRLGRDALPRFGLRADAPLTLLNHGENTVFRTRDRNGRTYALRIHRTDYQTAETIQSELRWLEAIRHDTELVVPHPVKGRDGQLVQQVSHPGVPGTRCCVLLHWVPGRFSWDRQGPAYYRRLGTLAGRLHTQAQSWRRPAGFQRRAWTAPVLLGEAPGFGDPLRTPGVTKSDRALFTQAMERARGVMRALGRGKGTWGLLHADMHAGNVLIHDGVMGAIDFDDCGEGWYGYEIAVALGPPFDMESFGRRLDFFLETYADHMKIHPRTIDAMECFVVTRRLSMTGWIGTRADNPRLAALAPRYIQLAREAARTWMNR